MSAPGNPHRAEAAVEIGSRRLTFRLSLQALAEIEAAFGADGLEALGRHFQRGGFRAGDLIRLAGALARGAGEPIADAELAAIIPASALPALIAAIGAVFEAGFGGDAPPDPRVPQPPPAA